MGFIEDLFHDLNDGEFIELRHQERPPAKGMTQYFCESVAEASETAKQLSEIGHLYFGIAPRAERKGTKAAIKRVQCLWADIDDSKEIPGWVLPPTYVVDSGYGIHVYWLLTESIPPADAENLNKGLAAAVGGDNVADCARIFRYPGSYNRKRTAAGVLCQLIQSNNVRYSASDVQAALNVPKSIVLAINDSDASESKSRSEKDWKISMSLCAAGMSQEGVKTILRNAPCGTKIREEGEHYLKQTLDKVFAQPKPVITKSPSKATLVEDEDGLYKENGDRKYQVSTFVPVLERLIRDVDRGDLFVCTIKTGIEPDFQVIIPPDAFNTRAHLRKVLKRSSCEWYGSDRELALLATYLSNQRLEIGINITPSTPLVGSYGDYWVGTKYTISLTEVNMNDYPPVIYAPRRGTFLETDYTPADNVPELARQVYELFPKLNRSQVLAPALGWTVACVFKELLWTKLRVRFPLLNLAGERGSGKTITVNNIVRPILGIVSPTSHEFNTTNFVRLAMLGSTNGLPISLTEYREGNSTRDAEFAKQLRELYDRSDDSRGCSDQSIITYPLLAPVVLDGEDFLQEPALMERAILVGMGQKTIEIGSEAWRAFQAYKDLPVQQLAASLIQFCMRSWPTVDLVWKEAHDLAEQVFKTVPIRSERIISNFTMVLLGLMQHHAWLTSLGVEPPYSLEPQNLFNLLSEALFNVINASGVTAMMCDEMFGAGVRHMAQADMDCRFPAVSMPTRNAVAVYTPGLHDWWYGEQHRLGRRTLEIKAIKAQVAARVIDNPSAPSRGQYILEHGTQTWINGKNYRMDVLNLAAMAEAGIDVPSVLPETLNFKYEEHHEA